MKTILTTIQRAFMSPEQLSAAAESTRKAADKLTQESQALEAKLVAHKQQRDRLASEVERLVTQLSNTRAEEAAYRDRAAACFEAAAAFSGNVHADPNAFPNAALGARDAQYLSEACGRIATELELKVKAASKAVEDFMALDAAVTGEKLLADSADQEAKFRASLHAPRGPDGTIIDGAPNL